MRTRRLQIIRWLHITLLLALLLPCLYAGDTVAREPGWCLHLKGLLLIIPVALSDVAIRKCKNLFLYVALCVAIIFVMLGIVSVVDSTLLLWGNGSISQERNLSPQKVILVAEAIIVMIGRFLGRADLSDVEIDADEQILRKPVSKSLLNEPSPNLISYFGIIYLIGIILKNSSLCNEALFSGMIYLLLALYFSYEKVTERYLALNRRVANLPGKRIYRISGGVMAMLLIGLMVMMLPAVLSIPVRDARMQRHRDVEYTSEAIREDPWVQSDLTEGAEAMWSRLGAPEDGLPKWLDYVALAVFTGSIILSVWLIYRFIRRAFISFQEGFDENGDQVEELQENSDFVSSMREGFKEPERNNDVRKRYRKMIRKHRKERPGVYETPAEIEAGAGLAGEPEMQELHALYEKVRYGR